MKDQGAIVPSIEGCLYVCMYICWVLKNLKKNKILDHNFLLLLYNQKNHRLRCSGYIVN